MDRDDFIEDMATCIPQKVISSNGEPFGLHSYFEQRLEIASALYRSGYITRISSESINDFNYLLEYMFEILYYQIKRLEGEKRSMLALARSCPDNPLDNYDPSERIKRFEEDILKVSRLIEMLSNDYYFKKSEYMKEVKKNGKF